MLEQFGEALSVKVLTDVMNWIRRRFARDRIRVETLLQRGPTSRELGFTETAIKVTVVNESEKAIRIKDVRLMFCGAFGASVAPTAPAGRSHPALPMRLDSGAEENWFIPAEKLSGLLCSLHHPQSPTRAATRTVMLHARCITGVGRVYKSCAFPFSTNPDSRWP